VDSVPIEAIACPTSTMCVLVDFEGRVIVGRA
jgi:hypothetical protein